MADPKAFYRVSGAWKSIPEAFYKVAGAWKLLQSGWRKTAGTWERAYLPIKRITISTNQVDYQLAAALTNPSYPAIIYVTIAAGVEVTASAITKYAFDASNISWDSILYITCNGSILGKGGKGGAGGNQTNFYDEVAGCTFLGSSTTAGGNAEDGGLAVRLGCTTIIDGSGLIQGGYGGGGGGDGPGGGGGGGAGYGAGGAAGSIIVDPPTCGANSVGEDGGAGTATTGGTGGNPPSGSNTGGNGGSPSASAQRGSGINGGTPGKNGGSIRTEGHPLTYSGVTIRGAIIEPAE